MTSARRAALRGLGSGLRLKAPRYVRNRTRLIPLEQANPDALWPTAKAVRLIAPMLRPSDRGAEIGSGRSAVWSTSLASHIASVQHDTLRCGRSAHGPIGPLWGEAAWQLADWRLISTTSGVPDTATFVRP
jgi:hypothetical protein